MRTVLLLFVVTLLSAACVKKQIVVNRLSGTWNFTKSMAKDGTYTYHTDCHYTFADGDADGSTYLDLTVSKDGVETSGKYLVNKKGAEIYLMNDVNFPTEIDTLVIEDMDKKSLIGHIPGVVWFFEKQ